MKTKPIILLLLCIAMAGVTGGCFNKCKMPYDQSTFYDFKKEEVRSAKHSIEQVVEIAKELAEKKGYSFERFTLSRISYDPKMDDQWVLRFVGNPKLIGDDFYVRVNDDTGETWLRAGE